ncbi:helix-turn-helix transcriptional regulator, partial [Micromonospora sp. NPDC047753]|uniref:helix-turn-helix domain-containing protein n=1 Tax=Micromonospora sp. NPDC047753 TaxID=3154817 RepID=UPI0033E33AD6
MSEQWIPSGTHQTSHGSAELVRVCTETQTLPELAGLLRQLRRREARQQGETLLTYRQLAAKTGWSRGIIGEYFAGNILPPPERFDVLIRLLGASPAEQGVLATARDRVEERRRRPNREHATSGRAVARAGVGGPRAGPTSPPFPKPPRKGGRGVGEEC